MRYIYVIEKEDLPKLLKGEDLKLDSGSNGVTAFNIEINGELTNGDMIKALYPNNTIKPHSTPIGVMGIDVRIYTDYHSCFDLWFPTSWWNAPYKEGDNNGINNR